MLVVALRTAAHDADTSLLPSPARLVVAGALMAASGWLGSSAWLSLFPEVSDRATMRRGYFLAQIGTYVPGAVWQPAVQVATASADVGVAAAAARIVVLAAVVVAAGGALGALAALVAPADLGVWRWLPLIGLAGLALLHPQVQALVLRAVGRLGLVREGSARAGASLFPPHHATQRAFVFVAASLAASASAYAVLVAGLSAGSSPIRVAVAFVAAWTVGFVALPFPSGLGVREGILVALLGDAVGQADVLAAAVAHRLVGVVANAVLLAVTTGRGGWKRPARENGAANRDSHR